MHKPLIVWHMEGGSLHDILKVQSCRIQNDNVKNTTIIHILQMGSQVKNGDLPKDKVEREPRLARGIDNRDIYRPQT